jgi:ketosteroid isomerase-like protein
LAYVSPGARLLTPDGTEMVGREKIHEVLKQLTAPGSAIGLEAPRLLMAGPVALCLQRWTINSNGAGADSYEQSFLATMVLSRDDRGGGWLLTIANLWGRVR